MSTAPDPAAGSGALRVRGLRKRYGSFTAVDGVDLDVPEGSFFALLGPSGCGKTTTLRMIAGLEDPTAGSIEIGGQDVSRLRAHQRPVNTVFQSYALFPHLTVYENVAFGLRRRKVDGIDAQVREMLELVDLAHLAQRRPAQLSGGQQQRVAVVRALVNRPKVLLLDEPLGALDLKLRRQLQLELKRIQTEVGITFVHVTHDQEEAMTMADTIAVLNQGRIEQLGSPVELYENPATAFVSGFLGQSNLLPATVMHRDGDVITLDCDGFRLAMPVSRAHTAGPAVQVGVRPEKIQIADEGRAPSGNVLDGTIVDASFTGVSTQYLVRTRGGREVTVFSQNTSTILRRAGERVTLYWDVAHTFALAGDTADGTAGSSTAAVNTAPDNTAPGNTAADIAVGAEVSS